jgi:hypothetical protein
MTTPTTAAAQHLVVHEWEADSGYRFWTGPFLTREASQADYEQQEALGHELSDTDCQYPCPACKAEGR